MDLVAGPQHVPGPPVCPPGERVVMRDPIDHHPLPRPLADPHLGTGGCRRRAEEVLRVSEGEPLELFVRPVEREGVGRRAHRVRRQHARVVALEVDRLEVPLEADVEQTLEEVVAIVSPGHGREVDVGLAVPVGSELEPHQVPRYVE